MTSSLQLRKNVLAAFMLPGFVMDELLTYNERRLDIGLLKEPLIFPLPDQPMIEDWHKTFFERDLNLRSDLSNFLVQLQFPVKNGISHTSDYILATRRGFSPSGMSEATGLKLGKKPKFFLHPTWAGTIPVLVAETLEDFRALVCALLARNEPIYVPESMGGCFISGYHNWWRFSRQRDLWKTSHVGEPFSLKCVPNKQDYQDSFIILTESWYSGIPPRVVGMDDHNWRTLSFIIRREHECAHYLMKRVFGSAKNGVLDELIADYCGIYAAVRTLRPGWLTLFLGLDQYPVVPLHARIRNYLGTPKLSRAAFLILQKLVINAAINLERFHAQNKAEIETNRGLLLIVLTVSSLTLEEVASTDAPKLLFIQLSRALQQIKFRVA